MFTFTWHNIAYNLCKNCWSDTCKKKNLKAARAPTFCGIVAYPTYRIVCDNEFFKSVCLSTNDLHFECNQKRFRKWGPRLNCIHLLNILLLKASWGKRKSENKTNQKGGDRSSPFYLMSIAEPQILTSRLHIASNIRNTTWSYWMTEAAVRLISRLPQLYGDSRSISSF